MTIKLSRRGVLAFGAEAALSVGIGPPACAADREVRIGWQKAVPSPF